MGISPSSNQSTQPKFTGRYQIIEELGRGGFAIVYRAHDTSSFNREVAVKVLREHLLEDTFVRHRFNREIATIAQLEDEAIVPVYDCGEEEGQPFIVMRLMTGGTLKNKLDQGLIPIEETLQIAERLTSAVETAHSRNIIHRDIKPANILFDGRDRAYLTDFGIARILDSGTEVTKFSGFIGTPEYASPEQVLKRKDIDWRSDIFSLGVIIFQMLTGEKPFPQFGSPYSPTPSVCEHRPDLPPQIDKVIDTVLAKDKTERYKSASEFTNALLGAIAGRDASGPLPGRRTPTGPVAPTTINGYEIINRLGEGSQGVVYRAHDPEHNRDVAIKLLDPRFFENENELKAGLETLDRRVFTVAEAAGDAAVLPVIEVGTANGRLYTVTPYMAGGSLADQIREGRVVLSDAIRTLERLAPTLDRVHQAGLVHGDLKPENILFDLNDQPYLMDFGMAHFIHGAQGMTTGSSSIGSYHYWSPEQASGIEHLTPGSDIYALGVITQEWLTRLVQPPPALESWLQKAVEKDPARRFTSVTKMAAALKSAATRPQRVKGGLRRGGMVFFMLVVLAGLVYLVQNDFHLFQAAATNTPAATAITRVEPTATSAPTETEFAAIIPPTVAPTLELTQTAIPTDIPEVTGVPVPAAVTKGGADLLAFVSGNEIWVVNVDGSEPRQITNTGGGVKLGLQWTPDGKTVLYITNKCVLYVDLETQSTGIIFCPSWVDYVGAFQISPDGTQVALSTSDGLYVLPYDLTMISNLRTKQQLENAEICTSYTSTRTKAVRWSDTGNEIAVVVVLTDQGRAVDRIKVFKIDRCGRSPIPLDEFPRDTGIISNYNSKPVITDFDWNGDSLFAMTTDQLHEYGQIYIYDMRTKLTNVIQPIKGQCCYLGFRWSPDAQYLLFAFQDRRYGVGAELYFEIFGTISGDQVYQPLPLPEEILSGQIENPQPVFRPSP